MQHFYLYLDLDSKHKHDHNSKSHLLKESAQQSFIYFHPIQQHVEADAIRREAEHNLDRLPICNQIKLSYVYYSLQFRFFKLSYSVGVGRKTTM